MALPDDYSKFKFIRPHLKIPLASTDDRGREESPKFPGEPFQGSGAEHVRFYWVRSQGTSFDFNLDSHKAVILTALSPQVISGHQNRNVSC